jgi:hypothetical protein
MGDFWLVLRLHSSLTLRGVVQGKRWGRLALAFGAALFAALAYGVTRGTHSLLVFLGRALADYPDVHQGIIQNLLMGWSIMVVAFILVNAMSSIYGTLYGSEDTGYLLATPLNPRSLFAARFVESLVSYVVMALPAGFGPFVAFGLVSGAGAGYYLVSLLAFLAYLVVLVSLAAAFITVVLGFVPGGRFKRLLMMAGLVTGLAIAFGIQYLATNIAHTPDQLGLLRGIGELGLGRWPVLPHVWLVRAAAGTAAGEAGALCYVGLLIVLASALVAALVWSAATVYVRGWASMQEADGGRRRRRRGQRSATSRALSGRSLLAHPFWAIARKDLVVSLRFPIHWYMVAIGVILAGFQLVGLRMQGDRVYAGQPPFIASMMVVGGASLGAALMAGSSFSREGDNIGLLQTWPVAPLTIFWAKICGALPVPLLLVSAGVVGFARLAGVQSIPLWPNLALAWAIIPSLLVVLLGVDTLMPNFRFTAGLQPGSKHGSGAAFKTLIIAYASFAMIALGFATWGLHGSYTQIAWLAGLSPEAASGLAYFLFAVQTLGVMLIVPVLGARRIAASSEG